MLRSPAIRLVSQYIKRSGGIQRSLCVSSKSFPMKGVSSLRVFSAICSSNAVYHSFEIQKRYMASGHEKYMKIESLFCCFVMNSLKEKKNKKEKQKKVIQMNQFSVALVGRTNVGKSTLFNRLVGHKEAIVSRMEGTTRDRREGKGAISGLEFTLIDTGGYVVDYKGITEYP